MKDTDGKETLKIPLGSDDIHYLAALNASESFKNNFIKLAEHFRSLKGVYQATETDLKGVAGLNPRTVEIIPKIREKFKPGYGMERLLNKEIRLVSYWDESYPASLKSISHPPPLLYVAGDIKYIYELSVAIVGTRQASRQGLENARKFGRELTNLGFTIISGGASGIDSEAHRGAIECRGKTFAVLGSGIDVFFPKQNERLFKEITSFGALISEFPPGTQPEPFRFPIRNRIIAGMSRGVLVIEAPERSGALITAEYAGEAGRELMALPGRIDDFSYKGTNLLIRDGAKMILEPDDIPMAFNLHIEKRKGNEKNLPELNGVKKKIIDTLGWEPRQIDELARESGIPIAELSAELLQMLMDGYVKEIPGKRYIRIAT